MPQRVFTVKQFHISIHALLLNWQSHSVSYCNLILGLLLVEKQVPLLGTFHTLSLKCQTQCASNKWGTAGAYWVLVWFNTIIHDSSYRCTFGQSSIPPDRMSLHCLHMSTTKQIWCQFSVLYSLLHMICTVYLLWHNSTQTGDAPSGSWIEFIPLRIPDNPLCLNLSRGAINKKAVIQALLWIMPCSIIMWLPVSHFIMVNYFTIHHSYQ